MCYKAQETRKPSGGLPPTPTTPSRSPEWRRDVLFVKVEFVRADIKSILIGSNLGIVREARAAWIRGIRGVHRVDVVRSRGVVGLADREVNLRLGQWVARGIVCCHPLQDEPAADV